MIWLILAVILWGVVHSVTASNKFKSMLQKRLGQGYSRYYRLIYNIFSVVSFAPILYWMLILPDRELYQVPEPWNLLMRGIQGFALFFLALSLFQTDPLSFAGLSQLFGEQKRGSLVVTGIYRYVRHPLYTFGLMILWATPSMSLNLLVLYGLLTLYIFIGAQFEERKLLREFGNAYAEYRSVTPMFIPGLKLRRNN